METLQRVEQMSDEQVLAAFGTAEESTARGYDEATEARVLARELVRARHRLAFYRTLYGTFVEVGKPYMIENLDETQNGEGAVPAKLVFSDDAAHVAGLEETGNVVVWTEPDLLQSLTQERAILDFFTDLLDELMIARQEP